LVVADGGGSNTGTFQTGPGAVCTWTSTYTFNTGSQFLGAGLNSLQGTAIFTGNFFSANLEWDSGSYIGPGTNLAGSTFVIKTGNDHNMPDQTLCNLGTIIHKDGNIRGGGSTIVNSGTWQEESDKQINDDYSGYGSFSFINNGLFHRVGDNGSTTFTAGTALANNGTLTVENGSVICNGSYTHNNGALNFGLSSSSPAVYGSLGLSGPVTFNGTLAIHLLGGYTPLLGDTFTVISYPSYSGNFANLNLSPVPAGDMWQVNYNAANVVLKVVSPGATGPQIVGTVKDAPTHGVAGITVAAFTTGNPSIYTSTTTDGAGNYTVGVTNGDWVVGLENLAAAGFNPVPDQAAVVSAPKTEVDFLVQVTGATTPGAVTAAATSITAGGATLNGTATPNGETVSVYYNYGLSSAYGQSTSTNTITANLNTSQAQPMIVTGLAAGTLYHFQLVVVNSMGNAGGGDLTFTTASAPVVITAAATDIGATNATFNGSINPKGLASAWYFEYGTDLNYGSYSATSSIPAGLAFLVATNECTNLAPATVYHFQLVGANSSGTNFGGDFMLTTDPTAPYVTTVAASSVTASSATLNASVNPNGKQTMAYIEYGLDATYGSFTPTNTFAAGSEAQAMPQPLAGGLAANQTYHFRAVGWNSLGTNQGADMTFATGTIAPEIQCPLDITANSAPGQCQQTLAFAATVTAGSPAPVVTYQLNGSEITSPYSFPVGQSVVSVTATNVAGTNSCSFMVTVVDDQLPIPGPNQMGVSQGAPAAVDVAKMLLSCSSPSGQPLHITSVTSPTVGHASVAIQGGQIVYSNIFIGTDVLNYTLSDGCGTATGTIMVQVLSTNLPSLNQVSLTPGSTGMTVVFNGVPGVTYIVQSSPSASGPWSDLSGQIQANGIGLVQYTDSSSSPTGFYRTRVVGH